MWKQPIKIICCIKSRGRADQVTFRELDQLVKEGVQQLSPQQQRAFRLSRMQGLTHDEIAAEMQISRATVKEHIVKSAGIFKGNT